MRAEPARSDGHEAPAPRPGTFSALRERNFRLLWIGTIASYVAFFMSTIVQSVVAFELVGTNRAVGIVVFAQGLAMAVLGPLGGALADRWPKRRIVALSQTSSAIVFATLATMLVKGSLSLPRLAVGTLLLGAGLSFLAPARQALTAEIVPGDVRGNAIALNQVALTGSQVLGPACAGALLASPVGAAGAYGLMAALYALAATMLALLPSSPARSNAAETRVLADLAAGLRYVATHPRLRVLVLFFVSVVMAGFPYVTLLPGLVENELGRDAEAISVLYLVSASGGLCASLVAARLADTRFAQPFFVATALLFAAALAALSAVPSYAVAPAAMLFVGMGFGGFQSSNGAVIVRACEPEYFGRVFSLTMLAFAGFGLMGLPIGLLADALGERGALRAMALAVALVCAIAALRLRAIARPEGIA
jgi:predicted MFS family arabinose efflux permease